MKNKTVSDRVSSSSWRQFNTDAICFDPSSSGLQNDHVCVCNPSDMKCEKNNLSRNNNRKQIARGLQYFDDFVNVYVKVRLIANKKQNSSRNENTFEFSCIREIIIMKFRAVSKDGNRFN